MKLPRKQDRLPRCFYDRSPATVARQLLGKALLHRVGETWLGGTIVETEAYLAERDLASHSARGQTRSNAAMFGPPGTLYVYPIHAKYCMNVVTQEVGRGSAVLIRAIEPKWGIDQMRVYRGYDDVRRLTRGPAMLCQALAVDRRDDHRDLLESPDFMIATVFEKERCEIVATPRIGISRDQDKPLRFIIKANRFVSGPRSHSFRGKE